MIVDVTFILFNLFLLFFVLFFVIQNEVFVVVCFSIRMYTYVHMQVTVGVCA